MENANKQICRLCLEVILDGDSEVIEESKKEILDTLLIKINFDISDNAVACQKCLVKLQDFYEFKSNCFYMNDCITPFMDADVKVDIKYVFEKVTMSSENVNVDNSRMCRLCMSFIVDEAFNCYTSDLKDMIRNCLPDVNLNSVDEPLVCKPCLSNITRYNEFMKSCEEVEQKIKNYIQMGEDHGIASKIILKDVLELKKCGTLSKPLEKQCLDVENETKCLRNEEAVNIKCEEIDIKDELDIGVEMSEVVKSENVNSSEKNGSLKKTKVGKTITKGNAFCCPKRPYSTNKHRLKTHMRTHLNNKVFACNLCSFVTDSKLSLKAHSVKVHRGPTKRYGCHQCPYETERRVYLQKHLLKHKDQSASLQHQKLEHSENIKMYKCEKCSFSTKHRVSFVGHQLVHKDPGGIPKHEDLESMGKFSCDQCTYSTYHKGYLHRHKRAHHKNDIRRIYKCNLCDYQAKTNTCLENHMHKTHMDPSKVPTFKCALCPYESTLKRYLTKHTLRCRNQKKQSTFECTLCPFVTKVKDNLRRHSRTQHEPTLTIKCDQCDFRTKQKGNLQQHMKLHESVKPPMFKCDKCGYSTWRKGNLKNHKVTHTNLGVYKCKLCNYQANTRFILKDHTIAIHMDPCKVPTFKCALCPYEGTTKKYLSKHIKRCHNNKDQPTLKAVLNNLQNSA